MPPERDFNEQGDRLPAEGSGPPAKGPFHPDRIHERVATYENAASPEERPLTREEIAKLRGRTRSHLLDLAEYEDIIDRLIGMVVSVTDDERLDELEAAMLGVVGDPSDDNKAEARLRAAVERLRREYR